MAHPAYQDPLSEPSQRLITQVNIHDAKTNLSKYLAQVEETQQPIIICRNGKPVGQIAPYKKKQDRKFGQWKGLISISDDFDELPEALKEFFT